MVAPFRLDGSVFIGIAESAPRVKVVLGMMRTVGNLLYLAQEAQYVFGHAYGLTFLIHADIWRSVPP
jgi:hypothetical protein